VPAPGAWTSDAACTGIHWTGRYGGGHGDDCIIEVTGSTPDVHGLEFHAGVIPITGGPQWPYPPVETPDVLPVVHGTIGGEYDLTGDGNNDIVVSYLRPSVGLVYMLIRSQKDQVHDGMFLAPQLSSDLGFTPAPRSLLFTRGARADFNNDGKQDLFFVTQLPDMSGHLYWYTMSYAGGEVVKFNETDSGVSVAPCATVESLRDGYLLLSNSQDAPLDFNLDGKADQVVVMDSASGFRFFIAAGAGDGTFARTIEVPPYMGQLPYDQPQDINKDGIPDLLVYFSNPDGTTTRVTLYGDGAFGFSPTSP
jgi:FG-GAP-like repeat